MKAIATKLNRLERAANLRGPGSHHRVELCERHIADILLRMHPALPDVEREDCHDEEEYRSIRRLLANSANNGDEAYRWRRLGPLLTRDEIFQKLDDIRQNHINGELSKYERIDGNIKRRQEAGERP
ncbi:MAG: hypothetical protein O7G85_08435 [Planctomycetota bacterium]|nr:hypothetical protein [Planctomycetota bacterium]